jgi:maltooligosyltrehalose trehalohydrolase
MITPRRDGGHGIDAQWSDDFHHALHVALTGEVTGYYADFERLDALAKVFTHGFFHDGTYSSFRERDHGSPIDPSAIATWQLVVANQNHDQIGNRAAGDRLAATLTTEQLAIAAVVTLASPFTPMLFMGEEWATATPWQFFTSHPEPALGRATAEGRIAEFARMGWDPGMVPDPQDPATFARSKLNWRELDEPQHRDMFELYRALIEIRRGYPTITDPDFTNIAIDHSAEERWIAIQRHPDITVVVNFAETEVTLPYGGTLILGTRPHTTVDDNAVQLDPWSAAIIDSRWTRQGGTPTGPTG